MFRFVRVTALAMCLVLCTICAPRPAGADSIWSRREPRNAFLFEDNKGRRIGDLLTITVVEASAIGEREQRGLNKTASFAHIFAFKGDSSSGSSSLKGAADLNLSGSANRTLAGNAQYTSDRSFTDKMTVTIIDVLPNGNLVVEGFRTRFLAGEERTLRVTGIVRPTDIGAANTVQSQYIGNFQISYAGKGPETTFTQYGWFGRAMNFIWPF